MTESETKDSFASSPDNDDANDKSHNKEVSLVNDSSNHNDNDNDKSHDKEVSAVDDSNHNDSDQDIEHDHVIERRGSILKVPGDNYQKHPERHVAFDIKENELYSIEKQITLLNAQSNSTDGDSGNQHEEVINIGKSQLQIDFLDIAQTKDSLSNVTDCNELCSLLKIKNHHLLDGLLMKKKSGKDFTAKKRYVRINTKHKMIMWSKSNDFVKCKYLMIISRAVSRDALNSSKSSGSVVSVSVERPDNLLDSWLWMGSITNITYDLKQSMVSLQASESGNDLKLWVSLYF